MNTTILSPAQTQVHKPMITLTHEVTLKGYQVQACIRERKKQHPFIAVLLLAAEQGAVLSKEVLHQKLLNALPLQASKNLLDRLSAQGYFKAESDSGKYELTDLGWQSAQNQEVWTYLEGLFNLYLIESPFVTQKIVAMESPQPTPQRNHSEKSNQSNEEEKPIYLPTSLKNLSEQFELGDKTFKWESVENKCFELHDIKAKMTLSADSQKGVQLRLKGGEVNYGQTVSDLSYGEIRKNLLSGEFRDLYDADNDWVSVRFNQQTLDFQRKVTIRKPELKGFLFSPSEVNLVNHQPEDESSAQQWFEALLAQKLDSYLFSEADFESFQKQVLSPFDSFTPTLLTRQEMIHTLAQNPDHFYQRMKLLAPVLLA